MTTARRPRRTRAIIAIAAGALAVGGCAVRSPVQTDHDYAAADGVNIDLGKVKLRNVLLVADGAGGRARLAGFAVNDGDSSTTIQFAIPNAGTTSVSVPARSTMALAEGKATLGPLPKDANGVPYQPGSVVPMTVAPSGAETGALSVPILPATGLYESLAPEGSAAS